MAELESSASGSAQASSLQRLLTIMDALRDPQSGCPWDLQQDFRSIVPHSIEELYEVVERIEADDMPGLCEELGDLLFQIVFYARLAKERAAFEFDDVVRAISDKLVRRHPHVFADEKVANAEEQGQRWEAIKRLERSAPADDGSALDGIAALPAFQRAMKLQKRAASVGFDWPDVQPVMDKLLEEVEELRECVPSLNPEREWPLNQDVSARQLDELGDVLFSVVNLARHLKIDPETALRQANRKFEARFRDLECGCKSDGLAVSDCSVDQLEVRWQDAKRTC